MSKRPTRALVTPEFRMSYTSLIEARPYTDPNTGKPTDKKSYQTEALFAPDAVDHFRIFDQAEGKYVEVNLPKLLVQLANEAWPNMVFPEGHPSVGQPMSVKQLFEVQLNAGWPITRGEVVKARRAANAAKKGKSFSGDHYDGTLVMNFKSNESDNVQPPALSKVTGANTFKVLERSNDVDMRDAKNLFVGGNYAFATVSIVANEFGGRRFLTPYVNGIRFTRPGKRIGGQSEMDRFDGVSGGAQAHNPTAGMDDEIPF